MSFSLLFYNLDDDSSIWVSFSHSRRLTIFRFLTEFQRVCLSVYVSFSMTKHMDFKHTYMLRSLFFDSILGDFAQACILVLI